MHWGVARTRAALALIVVAAVAVALLSGGSSSDPRTPPALPGMPPPFLTVAVVGDGRLTAGIDAYGDVVDLRAPGPAGAALLDNPYERQLAGTVPADTGIVPRVDVAGGPPLPLWRAGAVRQHYLPGTNVLSTEARYGHVAGGPGPVMVTIECAANGGDLGCIARSPRGSPRARLSFIRNLSSGAGRVHLDDAAARRTIEAATAADRRWLQRARPLGRAPAWARRLYSRSLLAMRALTDRRSGAVAAGARDGWAYVWPRDASAVAIALAAAGYRDEARRTARFLLGLDLEAAARFDEEGNAIGGRGAQGDATGWVTGAARAAGLSAPVAGTEWRNRADYEEKSPGDYLANALSSAGGDLAGFVTGRGLIREAGEPGSGLDSAAAWAVRPFPHPALFAAARRTLLALLPAHEGRFGRGAARFGLTPSEELARGRPVERADGLERLEPRRPVSTRRAARPPPPAIGRRRWRWPATCAGPRPRPDSSPSASTLAPACRARQRRSPGRTPSRCSPCASSGRPQRPPASARATASRAVEAGVTPGPPSISPIPETSQLLRATTGRPRLRAWATSLSVPHSPPTAIAASPEATTARLRACPVPVATTWVQWGLASPRSVPGRIPITVPPAPLAPRAAASITPGPPPQTTVAPASASSLPTSSANFQDSLLSSQRLLPMTEI